MTVPTDATLLTVGVKGEGIVETTEGLGVLETQARRTEEATTSLSSSQAKSGDALRNLTGTQQSIVEGYEKLTFAQRAYAEGNDAVVRAYEAEYQIALKRFAAEAQGYDNLNAAQRRYLQNSVEAQAAVQAEANVTLALGRAQKELAENTKFVTAMAEADRNAWKGVKETMDSVDASHRRMAEGAARLTTEVKSQDIATVALTADTQKLMDKYDPMGTKLRNAQANLAAFHAEMERGAGKGLDDGAIERTYAGLNKEIAKTKALMKEADLEGGFERGANGANMFSLSTQRARRELAVLGHEALSGNFAQMPGSFLILAQSMNLTAAAIVGLVAPLAAIAAVFGGVVAGFILGWKEMDHFNESIAKSGNYAGTTRGQMLELSKSLTEVSYIGLAASKELVNTLVASGKIGAQSLGAIAKVAADYAQVTGEEISKVGPEFVKLFENPLKGAEKLNETMHFLTTKQIEYIKTLQDSGHEEDARAYLAEQAANRIKTLMENQERQLGVLQKAWGLLRKDAGDAWDAMLGIGRAVTPEEAAERARKLAEAVRRGQSIPQLGGSGFEGPTQLEDRAGAAAENAEDMRERARFSQQIADSEGRAAAQMERQSEFNKIIKTSTEGRVSELRQELKDLEAKHGLVTLTAKQELEYKSKVSDINKQIDAALTKGQGFGISSLQDAKKAAEAAQIEFDNLSKTVETRMSPAMKHLIELEGDPKFIKLSEALKEQERNYLLTADAIQHSIAAKKDDLALDKEISGIQQKFAAAQAAAARTNATTQAAEQKAQLQIMLANAREAYDIGLIDFKEYYEAQTTALRRELEIQAGLEEGVVQAQQKVVDGLKRQLASLDPSDPKFAGMTEFMKKYGELAGQLEIAIANLDAAESKRNLTLQKAQQVGSDYIEKYLIPAHKGTLQTIPAIQAEIDKLELETQAIGATKDQLILLQIARIEDLKAREDSTTVQGAKDIAFYDMEIKKLQELRGAIEKNKQANELKTLITDADHALSNFLERLLNKGRNSFRDLWDDFKKWAFKAFAEVAARQIIISVVGAFGGGGGLVGQIANGLTGGSGSSLLNLLFNNSGRLTDLLTGAGGGANNIPPPGTGTGNFDYGPGAATGGVDIPAAGSGTGSFDYSAGANTGGIDFASSTGGLPTASIYQSIMQGAGNLLFGVGTAGAAALGAGFSAGASTLSIVASTTLAEGFAAGTAAVGGMSSALGALGAVAVPVIGWALAAYTVFEMFFDKPRGGPKTQGAGGTSFNQYGANIGPVSDAQHMVGITGDNQSASDATKFATAIGVGFYETLRQLGGTSTGLNFGVGFSTDPKGTAPSFAHTSVTDASGAVVFQQNNDNVGRSDEELKVELELQASRAVLAALQQSQLPKYIADMLNTVSATTGSLEDIQKIEASVGAVVMVVKTFGDAIKGLGPTIEGLDASKILSFVEALGGAQKFAEAMTFFGNNFSTAADRATQSQNNLTRAWEAAGVTADDLAHAGLSQLPRTHSEFVTLFNSLLAGDERAQHLAATLLTQVAPAFVAVAGSADQVAAALAGARQFYSQNFLTPREQLGERQTFDSTLLHAATSSGTILNQVLHEMGMTEIPLTVAGVRQWHDAVIAKYGADSAEANAMLAVIPIIGDLIDSVGGLGNAAKIASDQLALATVQTQLRGGSELDVLRLNQAYLTTQFKNNNPQFSGTPQQIAGTLRGITPEDFANYSEADRQIILGILNNQQQINKAVDSASQAIQNTVDSIADIQAKAQGLVDNLSNLSFGDFGAQLTQKITNLQAEIDQAFAKANTPEQIALHGITHETTSDPRYGPVRTEYTGTNVAVVTFLNSLAQSQATFADELSRFTALSEQYDAARAEQLVKLQDWYKEQQKIFAHDPAGLAALKISFDNRWKAIVDGAILSIDEFFKHIQGLAGSLGGNVSQGAQLQQQFVNARLADLSAQYATVDPLSAIGKAIKVDIVKLQTYGADLAQQIEHYATYTAEFGSEKANQLVELENWYRDQKAVIAKELKGHPEQLTASLGILAEVFDEKWQAIIDGATAATLSLDEFISRLRGVADAAGGDAGQRARLAAAIVQPRLETLETKYATLDPNTAVAKAMLIDINKLREQNEEFATQLAHFTIYSAQYGKDKANQLVDLEVAYEQQKKDVIALGGNADALAILAEIFNENFQDIIDGVSGGVDQLIQLKQQIADFLKGLFISDLSPLTPTQKLDSARTALDAEIALAQQGNVKALGDVTQFLQAFLQQDRAVNASNETFTADFIKYTAILGNLAGTQPNGQPLDPLTALASVLPANSTLASSADIANLGSSLTGISPVVAANTAIDNSTVQTAIDNSTVANAVNTTTQNADNSTVASSVQQITTAINNSTSTIQSAIDNSVAETQNAFTSAVANYLSTINNSTSTQSSVSTAIDNAFVSTRTAIDASTLAIENKIDNSVTSTQSAINNVQNSLQQISTAIDNSVLSTQNAINSAFADYSQTQNTIDNSTASQTANSNVSTQTTLANSTSTQTAIDNTTLANSLQQSIDNSTAVQTSLDNSLQQISTALDSSTSTQNTISNSALDNSLQQISTILNNSTAIQNTLGDSTTSTQTAIDNSTATNSSASSTTNFFTANNIAPEVLDYLKTIAAAATLEATAPEFKLDVAAPTIDLAPLNSALPKTSTIASKEDIKENTDATKRLEGTMVDLISALIESNTTDSTIETQALKTALAAIQEELSTR